MENVFVFCVFLTSQHFWLASYFWIAHFIDFGEIMYLLALPSPIKSKGVSVIQDYNGILSLGNSSLMLESPEEKIGKANPL